MSGVIFVIPSGSKEHFSCCSVTQSCPTRCDPMDCSTPGFPVLHQPPELAQTHVHWVGDAIQPSHPLSSPSPAFNLSQHQGLFQWVSSLHQVGKGLELQLPHQSVFLLTVGYYLVKSAGEVWGNADFLHYLWKRLTIDLYTLWSPSDHIFLLFTGSSCKDKANTVQWTTRSTSWCEQSLLQTEIVLVRLSKAYRCLGMKNWLGYTLSFPLIVFPRYWAWFPVLDSRTFSFVHSILNHLRLLIPNSQSQVYLAIYFIFKIYLFLAALGLCCCMQAFSSCSSGGCSLFRCMGFSMQWLFLLQHEAFVVVMHRLSCSAACGIFLDQGLNPCLLHFQRDSYPLDQQGSPRYVF